ncbi:Fatty acid synthase [Eumeta japonica]|uniref:Fatty acid synthase n=1 Tax=Eumeta variegata TaxID=151549 RepID=A0A4C1W488_EUMVA|nr:Fatty acid synthase [Eumeta japonica]
MSIAQCEDRLTSGYRLSHPEPGDEVYISGISGYFPDSDSVIHLGENLFNKVDLISGDDRRWKLSHPEIPQRTGKINNVEKFDASFFGVHYKQAHTMDPMCRIILEKAYEAIVDADSTVFLTELIYRRLKGRGGLAAGAPIEIQIDVSLLMSYGPLRVNPKELRNTKMGVFVGACFSESEKTWFYEKMQVNAFGITGLVFVSFDYEIENW